MLKPIFDVNGRITVDGAGAIDHFMGGLPYTVGNALVVVIDGTPTTPSQGRFLNVAGRLCVASVAAITSWANGLPFAADGALCVAAGGVIHHHSQGIPFTVADRVVTT